MTAKEFKQHLFVNQKSFYTVKNEFDIMIEFAKYHVEKAVKNTSKRAIGLKPLLNKSDKDFILDSYPLNKIK